MSRTPSKRVAGKSQVVLVDLSRKQVVSSTTENAATESTTSTCIQSEVQSKLVSSSGRQQYGRINRVTLDKRSEEYKKRRERNNAAVKKSRMISKERAEQTMQRVTELIEENIRLEKKAKTLKQEIILMKECLIKD